jgi:uncharacterized protein YrrD
MKKSEEIIGLSIISICDGADVGKVKAVIINADKGAIDYVVVDSGIQILGTRVIPAENILGIGEYALTIENEDSVYDISKIPAAIDLLQKNILVKATKVLTKKGRLIGEIGDIYADEEDNCSIVGLEFIAGTAGKNISIIPRESVITFGKNLIVVKEDVETKLVDSIDKLSGTAVKTDSEKGISDNIAADNTIPAGEISDVMEVKHREYLKGKVTTKNIYDTDGSILIEENTVIDDFIFDIAKDSDKVIELVMNNK